MRGFPSLSVGEKINLDPINGLEDISSFLHSGNLNNERVHLSFNLPKKAHFKSGLGNLLN